MTDSLASEGRAIITIAKIKPSLTEILVLPSSDGTGQVLDLSGGKGFQARQSSATLPVRAGVDLVVQGAKDDARLLLKLDPLVRAILSGQHGNILMQGETGSGKSTCLEGGTSEAGTPRQGLVPQLLAALLNGSVPVSSAPTVPSLIGAATVKLRMVEVRLSGPRTYLGDETFDSARAAFAAYRTAMKRVDKADRVGGLPGERQSSRSWCCLTLTVPSGGSLSIIDIPGKEFTHSESSNLINNLYHHLQDGLDLIAAGKASSLSLRPEERSPRRFIDLVLRKIIDGHGTVVIGCIAPSSRVRARTTLGVLAKLKDVVLPPIHHRPLTVTPVDAASQQQTAPDPPAAKGAVAPNMFFVDEEHRENYMSRIREFMQELSSDPEAETRRRQLDQQRAETAALGTALLSHLPELLEDMNAACIQEQVMLRGRREKLMVLLVDAFADCERKQTKNIVLIGNCLEGMVMELVERVENKLEEKFVKFFEQRFHSSDALRAIKQKLQIAYIDRMKEHAALIRVELKVFRLTNQLALERRRHAQMVAKEGMIREGHMVMIAGLQDELRKLRAKLEEQEKQQPMQPGCPAENFRRDGRLIKNIFAVTE